MNKSTTLILAGGNDRTTEGYAKHLEDELVKYISSRPKILSCFFSAPENEWPTKYQNWKEWFTTNFSFDFEYDYAQKATFLQQIDEADIIYLHGGNTQLLFDSLPNVDDLKRHLEGKVVVGSSAGANTLSKDYWSSSRAVPAHGLGIVDVNIMVHYGTLSHEGRVRTPEDWKKEEVEFQKFVGAEEIIHIPEGQFIVVQK
jgi:peptidase E